MTTIISTSRTYSQETALPKTTASPDRVIAIIALPVAAYAGYKVMDRLDRFLDGVHIGKKPV